MVMTQALMYSIECDRCGNEEPSADPQETHYYARRAFGWDLTADGEDICTRCRKSESATGESK